MKIVADWIKAIRKDYKTRSKAHIEKDVKIVQQLIIRANKTMSTSLAPAIRDQWKNVRPRLLSLQRNLEKRRSKLQEIM